MTDSTRHELKVPSEAAGQRIDVFIGEKLSLSRNRLKALFEADAVRAREWFGFIFTAPFFTFHFGFFCLIQGFFMMLLAGMTGTGTSIVDEVKAALSPADWSVSSFLEGLWPPLLLATCSHLYSFWKHTVRGGSSKPMQGLMHEPYGRIFVMQFTVVGGFWLTNTFTDRGLGPLLLMMGAKTVFDFMGHFKQHAND